MQRALRRLIPLTVRASGEQAGASAKTMTTVASPAATPFPLDGMVPKYETQAAQFLAKHPEYDGRHVKVAVFDTGIDPRAPGLATTTDGKPKIIEVIDCNGSGDVDMSREITADGSGDASGPLTITGLTGRTLTLSREWKNPTGVWRIGYKRQWDLFPEELIDRVQKERAKDFAVAHQRLVSQAIRDCRDFDAKHPKLSELSRDEIQQREDLKKRQESLEKLGKEHEDVGPLMDCVAWHDGEKYVAVIDKAGTTGDLSAYTPMAAYSVAQESDCFSEQDLLTYSYNFYDEGKVLSIVTVSGSHGTHVAGIIGANFPENPKLNGSAPGCQIVSLKIGDTRLSGMETGQGMVRACRALIDLGVDVVNISFGEDPALPNKGQIVQALKDAVFEHDITVISSAGNEGAVLTSVGAPGGTTSGIISVGAYVTKSMMKAEYSMINHVPEGSFTWSSRGPTADGAKGLSIYSPGGAITSVPRYCLQHSQLMNGTSMSSPCACGGVTLVLSALKQQNIKYTPHRIHKAVMFTSKDVQDPLNVGMLQVQDAYDEIIKYKDLSDQDIFFNVTSTDGTGVSRGVYLRQLYQSLGTVTKSISVNPILKESETELMTKIDLHLALKSTVEWIRCPDVLALSYGPRNFDIKIMADQLEEGFSFGSVDAYDSALPERKLFSIPVTVVKPLKVESPQIEWSYEFSAGKTCRKFITPPPGCSAITLEVETSGHTDNPIRAMIQSNQVVPHVRRSWTSTSGFTQLISDETFTKKIDIEPGYTVEICISQWWAAAGSMTAKMRAKFHGLSVESGSLDFKAGSVQQLLIKSNVAGETAKPELKFDRGVEYLRPDEAEILPLGERDLLVGGKQLISLVLSYKFDHEEGDVKLVLPYSNFIYDNGFHSLLSMVQNSTGKVVRFGDAYPKKFSLSKGSYTVKVQLVYDSVEKLKELRSTTVTLVRYLSGNDVISLSPFSDHYAVVTGKPLPQFALRKDESRSIVYSTDLSKTAASHMAGTLKLGKSEFPATLTAAPKAKDFDSDPQNDDDKPTLLELQIGILSKIPDKEQKGQFLSKLLSENPESIDLLKAALAESEDEKAKDGFADRIIHMVDMSALEQFYGQKAIDHPDKAERRKRKEMDKLKACLLSALQHKAASDVECYEALRRLQDSLDNGKTALATLQSYMARHLYGLALSLAMEYMSKNVKAKDADFDEIRKIKTECLEKLGWELWLAEEKLSNMVESPPEKALF